MKKLTLTLVIFALILTPFCMLMTTPTEAGGGSGYVTVRGTVYKLDGSQRVGVLSGAQVTITSVNGVGSQPVTVTSNANGEYEAQVPLDPKGEYTVDAQLNGYTQVTDPFVNIDCGDDPCEDTVDVDMAQNP